MILVTILAGLFSSAIIGFFVGVLVCAPRWR